MKEVQRIVKGSLSGGLIEIPIHFGLIFSDLGALTLDLYVEESFNLSSLMQDDKGGIWKADYTLKCKSSKDDLLEIDQLSFSRIDPHESTLKMVCYGKMVKTEIRKTPVPTRPDKRGETVHFLILEGLKIRFTDITEKPRARKGRKIEGLFDWKRDHTSALLVADKYPFNQVFYQPEGSNQIAVEFDNKSNNTLTHEKFTELKRDYLGALSFLNGATVSLRKEFIGSFCSQDASGTLGSEIEITYSFKSVINDRYNGYVPINDPFSISHNVLNTFFIHNFDNYRNWSSKIDLNSIVFYLSNSEQTRSMEEKVFIQMIAFERLTTLYANYLGETEEFLPCKEEFEEIKKELQTVLSKHKNKFGNAYNTVRGKVSNLNQIKRGSTSDKMYRLINDVNIPITSEIETLIDVIRNKTIHEGNIGEGEQFWTTFLLLDELIREIILRLVEFKGDRKSQILLQKTP
jgi:hypothetical protein